MGFGIRNKASFNLGSFVAPFANNDQNFFVQNLAHLNKVTIEPFYDYGYVKNKYADSGADGRLSGAGVKTIFNGKYFDASLSYSWATRKSSMVISTEKENKIVYFELSASCC